MLQNQVKKQLKLKKVLNGKALEADKYEFELKDSEGNLVDTTKEQNADGSITFKEIEYKDQAFILISSQKSWQGRKRYPTIQILTK